MTTESNPPQGTQPPNASPAGGGQPTAPAAPAAPGQSPGGGGGSSDNVEWLRAELRKATTQRDEWKGKVREQELAEAQDLQGQVEALQQQLSEKAKAETAALEQLQERDRLDRRRQFVDAILSRVPDGKREDFRLMLAGLEQNGDVVIPDENPTEAAAAELEKLADRYPGWFSGGSGSVGSPAGPGGGPLPAEWSALTPEQKEALSDEDFSKRYGNQRKKTGRKTMMG